MTWMAEGYIYVMTNPCLHDMVKIGYASDVEARRKQLSTTALPFEYEIYATYETSGQLEDKKLHELIDTLNPKLRLAKNREFFAMSAEKAYQLLEAIAIISGSADKLKRVVPMQGEGTVSSTRKQPHCQGSSGRKRPAINFKKYGKDAITLYQVIIENMDFEDEYNAAIQQKSIAQQTAARQEIENKTAIKKAEADKTVEIKKAEAKAEKMRIEAEAQANANKELADSISDALIDYQKIEKWDGKLPKVTDSNAIVSLDGDEEDADATGSENSENSGN